MLAALKYVLGGVNHINSIALKTSEWAVKIHGCSSWQYCACEGQSPVGYLELRSETCAFLWSTNVVCHTLYQVTSLYYSLFCFPSPPYVTAPSGSGGGLLILEAYQ